MTKTVAAPGPLRAAASAAAVLLLPPGIASATLSIVPYGSSSLEYNSNIFAVSSTANAPIENGQQVRDDFYNLSTIGIGSTWLTGEQTVRLKAEARKAVYNAATSLDHDEYLFGGGLDFTVLRNLTGTVDYSQERHITPFVNLGTTKLTITRDRNGGADIKYIVNNDWHTQAGFHHHEEVTPLATDASFKLQENTSGGSITYAGLGKVAVGVGGEYVVGHYSGSAADQNPFDQYSAVGIVNYEATGLSKFSFELGVNSRTDKTNNNGTATTSGEIHYRRALTGKTLLDFEVNRHIRSYPTGNNSVVDNTARIVAVWEATTKIRAQIDANLIYLKFRPVEVGDMTNNGRRDRQQVVTLAVDYSPLSWLSIHSFGGYQVQQSTRPVDSFNSATMGLELRLKFE